MPKIHANTEAILKAYPIKGVDISHWNGLIDMNKLVENGFKIVMIKAGDGYTTSDGKMFLDPDFYRNAKKATEAGLYVGYYFYFRPKRDPIAQARFFRQICKLAPEPHFQPIADVEASDGLSPAQVADSLEKFLNEVARLFSLSDSRLPIIYSRYSFLFSNIQGVGGAEYLYKYDWWFARYYREEPMGKWIIWQSSDKYRIPGIAGDIDLDHWRYGEKELKEYLGLSTKPRKRKPTEEIIRKRTITEELLSRGIPFRLGRDKREKVYIALSGRKDLKSMDDIAKL